MTQVLKPDTMVGVPASQQRWADYVYRAITGGLEQSIVIQQEPLDAGINAGVPSQFSVGNMKNQLIRIAASGVSNTNASYKWTLSNIGIVIKHELGRIPIGFKIVDKDKAVDVYRVSAPGIDTLVLAPTDATASVTLEIF